MHMAVLLFACIVCTAMGVLFENGTGERSLQNSARPIIRFYLDGIWPYTKTSTSSPYKKSKKKEQSPGPNSGHPLPKILTPYADLLLAMARQRHRFWGQLPVMPGFSPLVAQTGLSCQLWVPPRTCVQMSNASCLLLFSGGGANIVFLNHISYYSAAYFHVRHPHQCWLCVTSYLCLPFLLRACTYLVIIRRVLGSLLAYMMYAIDWAPGPLFLRSNSMYMYIHTYTVQYKNASLATPSRTAHLPCYQIHSQSTLQSRQ